MKNEIGIRARRYKMAVSKQNMEKKKKENYNHQDAWMVQLSSRT